jgi:hypothetical protein
VPLNQNPAPKGNPAAAAALSRDGRPRRVKYLFEAVQQPAAIKPLGWFVAGETGLGEEFQVTGVVPVQFDDSLDQGIQAGEMGRIDEAPRIVREGPKVSL